MLVIVKVSTGAVYPADNLRWTQANSPDGHGYAIHSVAAGFTGVSVPAEVTTSGQLNDLVLAQIGKSGRWFGLTDQYRNA